MLDELLCNLSKLRLPRERSILKASQNDVSPWVEWSHSLIFTMVIHRMYKPAGLKDMTSKAWKVDSSLVLDFTPGCYQVKFSDSFERDLVVDKGPWLFDNDLIVIHKGEAGKHPDDILFS
uniref:DUF4283 domain-containing protein n=1 Tax=Nelumbo nucifera TaxID=4432 RepID=A0A822ZRM3_NELNU|nr:TPA_asm: hypothetical protein HUJ06_004305 [Nelumbo nucifera]